MVLDEATNAMDLATEVAMYSMLIAEDMFYRPSLMRYHNKKLVLNGTGRDVVLMSLSEKQREQEALIDLTESSACVPITEFGS